MSNEAICELHAYVQSATFSNWLYSVLGLQEPTTSDAYFRLNNVPRPLRPNQLLEKKQLQLELTNKLVEYNPSKKIARCCSL